MKPRNVRTLLWISTAFATGIGLGSLLWAVIVPVTVETFPSKLSGTSSIETEGSSVENFSRLEDRQAADLNLHRPLHDAPPPAAPPPPPDVPVNIRLSGTIVEPGHSRAMIELPDGSMELKNVGDEAGNARILKIDDGKITVESSGHQQVLVVSKTGEN